MLKTSKYVVKYLIIFNTIIKNLKLKLKWMNNLNKNGYINLYKKL